MLNKRRISWIVIVLAAAVAAWYFFFKPGGIRLEPIDAIPANALLVIDAKNVNAIERNFFLAPQWSDLQSIQLIHNLDSATQLLKDFAQADPDLMQMVEHGKIVVSAITAGAGKVDYIFACKTEGFSLQKLQWSYKGIAAEVNTYNSNKETVYSFSVPGVVVSCAMVGKVLLFSMSEVLIESAISQVKASTGLNTFPLFKKLYDKGLKDTVPNVFFNMEQLGYYTGGFVKQDYYNVCRRLAGFTSWISLSFNFTDTGIEMSGYAGSAGLNTVLSQYRDAEYNFDEADNFLIGNTAFAFQGNRPLGILGENKNAGNAESLDWAPWLGTHYTYAVSQPYDASLSNKAYLIMQVIDRDMALSKLAILSENSTTNYRDFDIYKISDSEILQSVSGFGTGKQTVFACLIQGYIAVAPSINQLMQVIDAYLNQQTLKQDAAYEILKSRVASNCNYSVYLNPAFSGGLVKNTFASDAGSEFPFQKYNGLLLRFSASKELHIVSGNILYAPGAKQQSGFTWKTQIDYPVLNGPYAVFNHLSGKEYIFLQDTALQVYLISPDGNIEWKRAMAAPMTDKVYTVDYYSNGKKQIAFAAADGIHMLDMLGRDVEGFPISATTEVTSPLSLIDYDGRGDYRMFIGCGNGNIYGFYKDGKPLPGWSPLKNGAILKQAFTYIEKNQKDYILFANADGTVQIKNRKGENRINKIKAGNGFISELIPDAGSGNGRLLAIDSQFNLVQLTLDGKVQSTPVGSDIQDAALLDMQSDDTMDIIYLSSGTLYAETTAQKPLWQIPVNASGNSSIYTYTSNKNTYIGIADSQLHTLFLIHSDGTPVNGFPAEASGRFIVIESGSLVVSFKGNSIVAYNIK